MKCFLAGGAGFVGGHLYKRLTAAGATVKIYDKRLAKEGSGVCADIQDVELLASYMAGSDIVFHLASNADIAVSAQDPTLDFREGTQLTQKILEAMRRTGVKHIVYFSGSGVYGESLGVPFKEDSTNMHPISPYGASKLASEAMISAYCHMFGMTARVLRPANIVGPGQTHGVGYDFINRLRVNPTYLKVLGNGTQSKSYVHIDDVMDAVMMLLENPKPPRFSVFNVASKDCITVREIAEKSIEVMGLANVQIEYGATDRGWNGDVPSIRLDCDRLRNLGWKPGYLSIEAMFVALTSMKNEILPKS